MTSADSVQVKYSAVAHFLDLKKATAAARKDLEALQKEEAKANAASVAGSKKVAAGHTAATKAIRSRTVSTKTGTRAALEHVAALKEEARLLGVVGKAAQVNAAKQSTANAVLKDAANSVKKYKEEVKETAKATDTAAKATDYVRSSVSRSSVAFRRGSGPLRSWLTNMRNINKEHRKFIPLSQRTRAGLGDVFSSLRRVGNYRPRLIPPFIALIPIIAGLLGMLNPLVALLGAVGAAGFGAGASLLSLGGAALAIVPMLSAAIAAIGGLLTAFRGIGGVFQKYRAAKAAGGGGGGGGGDGKTYAERVAEAEEDLTDAQEDALFAQEDLNEARKDALKRLLDLRKAVANQALNEADAAAALQLATENYYNVLADPGSTLGDKMQALVDLQQAQQNISDVQAEGVEAAEELAKAEQDGIENDRQVLLAKRRLRDAIEAEADAYKKLRDAQAGITSGGGGGGGGAMDEFQEALAKLAPSAQKVVLALIAMGDAWAAMQKNVQEAFFSKIVDDMDELAGLIPTVEYMLTKASDALGRFAHDFIQLVSSEEWKGDFVLISDQNARLITLAGDGLLTILTLLKDLTIAAGPFTEKLIGGWADGLKDLSGIVAVARDTGSLAAWLDKVYERLQKWWSIVKNIAQMLFNYGAASSEFGDWITDGLLEWTEGWKRASEDARKEGSPFKVWLDDIKPLLSEVRSLFSDFFSWLGNTASNALFISEAVDIINAIRTDLGPELAETLDILARADVGENFVKSFAAIIDSLNTILENGGSDAVKAFFDTVRVFFDWLAGVFKRNPDLGGWLGTIGGALGILGGIVFIGKFTGLTGLIGWLIKGAKTGGMLSFLAGLAGLSSIPAAAAIPGAIGSGGGVHIPGAPAPTPIVAPPKGGNPLGKLGAAAKAAVPLALLFEAIRQAGVVVGSGIENIPTAISKAGTKEGRLAANAFGADVGANAGIGAPVGMVTSLIDAFAGTDLNEQWTKLFEGALNWWTEEFGPGIADWFTTELPRFIGEVGDNIWSGLEGVGKWLEENVIAPMREFFSDPWFYLGVAAGTIFHGLGDILTWLSEQGAALLLWLQGLPAMLAEAGGNIWSGIQGVWAWLSGTVWPEFVSWIQSLPSRIPALAGDVWRNIQGVGAWLSGTVWPGFLTWLQGLPTRVQTAAGDIWRNIQGIGGWLSGIGGQIWTWASGLPRAIAEAIGGNIFRFVSGWISTSAGGGVVASQNVTGNAGTGVMRAVSGGGSITPQYLATGGRASRVNKPGRTRDWKPVGTDTVPTMLTPGEFVFRKAIADRIGVDRLEKVNAGMMSFGEMFLSLQREERGKGSQNSVAYLDGGGLVGTRSVPSLAGNVTPKIGASAIVDNSQTYGDINVYYPKRERASRSLPDSLRKVGYASSGKRKPDPRLRGRGQDDE